MREPLAPLSDPLVFYHQNEPLLFQFLLHASLQALKILKMKKRDPRLLTQLMGTFECTSPTWQAPAGHLPKLFYYFTLFMKNFDTLSPEMHKEMMERLQQAFEAGRTLIQSKKLSEEKTKVLLALMRKEIRGFLSLLLELLPLYRECPTVLYFLLRHQEEFSAVYRQPVIKKAFSSLFPEGMQQAQQFLAEQFLRKGFLHVLAPIDDLMVHLK